MPLPPGSQPKKNNKKTRKITIKNNKQWSIIFNKTCLNNNLLSIHSSKYICLCIYISLSLSLSLSIYIYTRACVCVCVYMYICLYITRARIIQRAFESPGKVYDISMMKPNLKKSIDSLDCRIHWLHLCRGVRPTPTHPTSVLDMTLNYLMVRLKPWRFEEYGEPLHSHYSLINSDMEW